MPTVGSILSIMRFQRMIGGDKGSCFGVTDPSRLRPAFQSSSLSASHLCEGCRGKSTDLHQCTKKVKVFNLKTLESGKTSMKSRMVKCECSYCSSPRRKLKIPTQCLGCQSKNIKRHKCQKLLPGAEYESKEYCGCECNPPF